MPSTCCQGRQTAAAKVLFWGAAGWQCKQQDDEISATGTVVGGWQGTNGSSS
jgi:hypothetical protein